MPRDFGRGDDRRGDRGDRGDRHGGAGRGINPNYFLPKPVKVGDEVDVKIEAMASKGDGIAKKDGFVIFVKDAKEGQTLRVKITEVRTRFAMGEVLGEAEAAPEASADAASDSDESEEEA